jgi:hypothetical protein
MQDGKMAWAEIFTNRGWLTGRAGEPSQCTWSNLHLTMGERAIVSLMQSLQLCNAASV